jgi:hypothetical protein
VQRRKSSTGCSLDTEIPSEKYRLGRIVDAAGKAYCRVKKVCPQLPFLSSRGRQAIDRWHLLLAFKAALNRAETLETFERFFIACIQRRQILPGGK